MMKKINTVLVDDDFHMLNFLEKLCKHYFDSSLNIVGKADNVKDAQRVIRQTTPELLLLDIELKDKNAFDLLQELTDLSFEVIFITAHQEFAVKAFRFSAIDFLLKPINTSEFIEACNRAIKRIGSENVVNSILRSHTSVNTPTTQDTSKIAIPTVFGYSIINASDIIHCEADGSYTKIFLTKGINILTSKTLGFVEKNYLNDDFIRVHHSHIINIQHMIEFRKGNPPSVYLTNGFHISVSVRRKKSLEKLFRK